MGLRPMALVVVAATVLGGGYGTCRALAQHAAAVNGTAAGSILSLCAEVHEAVADLPTRGAEAAEFLSGASVAEWRATIEEAGRALAVELAAQSVVTAVLLLVRLRERGSPPQSVCVHASFAVQNVDPRGHCVCCVALELLCFALSAQPVGLVSEPSLRPCTCSLRG